MAAKTNGQRTCTEIDDAAARLYVLFGRFLRGVRRVGTAELGPGSVATLATLVRTGPMRLGDLAAREGVAPPTLTRIVAVLEEDGYLVRQVDPADRRVVRVAATAAGEEMVSGVHSARSVLIRDRLQALTVQQRDAVIAALPALEALVADDPEL